MTVQGMNQSAASSDTETKVTSYGTVDKEMFLKMLVTQIKYQDPLNPADGTEFVGQLAQFSELEQLIGVRTDVEKLRGALVPSSEGGE